MAFKKVVKIGSDDYAKLASGQSVSRNGKTLSALAADTVYLVEHDCPGKPKTVDFFSNSGASATYGWSSIGSAEIDYEREVVRMKATFYAANNNETSRTTFATVDALLAMVGMYTNGVGKGWNYDASAFDNSIGDKKIIGTWVRNDTLGYDPYWVSLFQGYCPIVYIKVVSGWPYVYFARSLSASDATDHMEEILNSDLLKGQGVTADITIPVKMQWGR